MNNELIEPFELPAKSKWFSCNRNLQVNVPIITSRVNICGL
jgi:hypothetical protein